MGQFLVLGILAVAQKKKIKVFLSLTAGIGGAIKISNPNYWNVIKCKNKNKEKLKFL